MAAGHQEAREADDHEDRPEGERNDAVDRATGDRPRSRVTDHDISLRTPVPPSVVTREVFGGNTGTDGCQTREIPTNGVVEGAGEPTAGSRETAKAASPRTPSISCVASPWPAGNTP